MSRSSDQFFGRSCRQGPLQPGLHYYYDESGLMVFTARYLQERGYCCKSGCRHCPYGYFPKDAMSDNPEKDKK